MFQNVDWIHLVKEGFQGRNVVNTVIKHRIKKRRESSDQLNNYQVLKNNSDPWGWL
jgi:hypothetical protein